MDINTERFGQINVPEDKIIYIREGVIGFEKNTRFILLDFLESSPLKWLQSTQEPSLAFIVCDPWYFFKDYAPVISKDDKIDIRLSLKDELGLLSIVTIPQDISKASFNLLSPIIINMDKLEGKQIILYDSDYTTKHKVLSTIKVSSKKFLQKQ